MGDLKSKKVIGNLGDPKLPYDYSTRPYGTVPEDRVIQLWVFQS